ncbi:hypothetical protein GMMP15_940034 [Candidatus Magnetomoraceae bacterium gMMP-15]
MINKIYDIKNFTVDLNKISFELAINKICVPLEKTGLKIFQTAKINYLQIFEIDEDGIGVYFPALDEDLSIEGLLKIAGREDLIVKNIPSVYLDESDENNKKFSKSKNYDFEEDEELQAA